MRRRLFEYEHEQFRESVRRFLQAEVMPHRQRWREQGIVDREAWLRAGEKGFLLLWAGEEYGGAGVDDFRYDQIMSEEWAKYGDPGFAVTLHNRIVGPYIGRLGTPEQKRRFLPGCVSGESILAIAITEAASGSDVASIRTHAERVNGRWILNGSKTYISNGILADLVIVVAKTNPENPRSMGLFVVERGMPGFERGRCLKKIGMKAQDTAEIFFDNVEVPHENVLGDPEGGFRELMKFLAEERLMGAIRYLANARHALDITLDYVRDRHLFGQSLGAFQNTRFKIAEMKAQIDMCQALVDHCVQEQLDAQLEGELAAEAKLVASEIEGWVVDECLQLHGGAGYMEEYEISTLYTNARVSRIYAGSSEIMKEIISRSLGLDPRKLQ